MQEDLSASEREIGSVANDDAGGQVLTMQRGWELRSAFELLY